MGRLLVVDDAMLMRKMIRDVAVEAGWEVVGEAKNGAGRGGPLRPAPARPRDDGRRDARDGRPRSPPDDPGLDPAARVVMVTALDQKQTLVESIRDGAIDFIVKPFDRERIVSLLGKIGVLTASRASVAEP